ncbi:PIN domain-containing protein [uncultured Sphingomonas sp.]|uniref:PIN domain-containing protein n=1 Tax=uncultured Sphingomonas sp. TaxID=158754 RepID=UPI0035C95261
MADRHILDASAVLCLLDDEPGADRIAAVLDNASISSVSVALVAAELTRRGADPQEVAAVLRELHLTVLPFGFEQAVDAGTFCSRAREEGTDLEQWALAAVAMKLGATAFTADRHDLSTSSGAEAAEVS